MAETFQFHSEIFGRNIMIVVSDDGELYIDGMQIRDLQDGEFAHFVRQYQSNVREHTMNHNLGGPFDGEFKIIFDDQMDKQNQEEPESVFGDVVEPPTLVGMGDR